MLTEHVTCTIKNWKMAEIFWFSRKILKCIFNAFKLQTIQYEQLNIRETETQTRQIRASKAIS